MTLDYDSGGNKDLNPQIVMDSDDSYVVFWENDDGTNRVIVSQGFNADGTIVGTTTKFADGEDPVILDFENEASSVMAAVYKDSSALKVSVANSSGFTTPVTLSNADIYMGYDIEEMASGKFAVVYRNNGFNSGAIVQKFNADGTTDGSAITLPGAATQNIVDPKLAFDSDDNSLLVLWDDGQASSSSTPGSKSDGIWMHKILADGTVETRASSFGFGSILDYSEVASDGTLTVLTSGVEDAQTATLTLGGTTYTGSVTSNQATITVSAADLVDLAAGNVAYTIDVDDAAGNSATQLSGSFSKNGISFAGIDVDDDGTIDFTDPSAKAGTDDSDDGQIDILIDVSHAVADDKFELYIDGTIINDGGTTITQSNIDSGTVTVSDVDISTNDSDISDTDVDVDDDEVLIKIVLKNGDSEITSGTDQDWEYQY